MKSITRTIITAVLLLTTAYLVTAQVAINTDGASPDSSAMLDINSADKGVLIPRMDSLSRQNISNPANGLLVFDTIFNSFWYYSDSTWLNLNAVLSDTDNDTKIQIEENPDEDVIRFDLNGTEFMRLDSGRMEVLNTGNSVFIGEGAGANDDFSDNENVFIGAASGNANTQGFWNVFIGESAGYSNDSGFGNTSIGNQSAFSNTTGFYNTALGWNSGYSNTEGRNNTFLGVASGYYNTTADFNTFIGSESGSFNTTGFQNTFLGGRAGIFNTTGFYNTFVGFQTGYSNTTGERNLFVGLEAGHANETGSNNTYLGNDAGENGTTGSYNVFIGRESGNSATGSNNVFLGYQSGYNETGDDKLYIENSNSSSPLIYGDFTADSLQINGTLNIGGSYHFPTTDGSVAQVLSTDGNGTLSWADVNAKSLSDTDGNTQIQVEESSNEDIIRFDLGGTEFMRLDNGRIEVLNTGSSVFLGEGAGANDDFSDNNNVFIGHQAGHNNDGDTGQGYGNTFTGYQAGYSNTTGYLNTFYGNQAGYSNTTGDENVFLGDRTGEDNTTGSSNTAVGYLAGNNNTTGSDNTFVGSIAGHENTTGTNNIAFGPSAGIGNRTGNNNISIGYFAGTLSNTSGSGNICIGYYAGLSESGDNKLYIGGGTSPLIYGDFDNDSLQINSILNIAGNYTFPTTDGSANQVLATDGSGALSWADANNPGFTTANGLTYSIANSDDFLFGADALDRSSGTESKFFFDNSKGAFRAGTVSGDNWDEGNIGDYSFAFGTDTQASGDYSTAFGSSSTASGEYSIVFGLLNGASGTSSIAFGTGTIASGSLSTTFGVSTTAKSYAEIALGAYNTDYTPDNTSGMDDDDRLLVVGNGTSSSDLSDALVIYKSGNTELNGNLGIGTTATNGKLEIDGHIDNTINGYTYLSNFNNSTVHVTANTDPKEVSIYATDRIVGQFVISLSDERIKDIKGISDSKADLATLQQIQITDYEFIDKIQEDGTQQKKVIAQQVAEVFPQAVEKHITEIVPDIYQAATIDEEGWITFNDESFELTDALTLGDQVRIYFEDDRELLEVLEISDNTFRVLLPTDHPVLSTENFPPSTNHSPLTTVFVYGRQVHDFHTVDYQAISMLNVSATQQLAKENEDLKARVAKLESLEEEVIQLRSQIDTINQLEQQNSEMKAMLEQIQQRLDHQ